MRRRKRRNQSADVSVTSLVDVAFTLLIVFIIIAPAMQSGIEVQLPKTEASGIDTQDKPVVITIDAGGELHLNDEPDPVPDLKEALLITASDPAITPVFVRADRSVPYEYVAKVLGVVTDLGYANLNLVTDPAAT